MKRQAREMKNEKHKRTTTFSKDKKSYDSSVERDEVSLPPATKTGEAKNDLALEGDSLIHIN